MGSHPLLRLGESGSLHPCRKRGELRSLSQGDARSLPSGSTAAPLLPLLRLKGTPVVVQKHSLCFEKPFCFLSLSFPVFLLESVGYLIYKTVFV